SRMKFLCDYLGDDYIHTNNNCDNTGERKLKVIVTPEWTDRLNKYRGDFFPILEVEDSNTNLINGIASSYYGTTIVGKTVHRSKYANGGDYPNFLVNITIKAFKNKFGSEKFDLILYVPPTVSGNLVRKFAKKVSVKLGIPLSNKLIKHRNTQEQKMFENGYLKSENVKNSFEYKREREIRGKRILLIDDIYDSGATIKEIGRYLTKIGAKTIAPLVIARTVRGDLAC
ncbi:MAG: phosphoribosyltransferase family protein, partial [Ignavibacteriota bacterium]